MSAQEGGISCSTFTSTGFLFSVDSATPRVYETAKRYIPGRVEPGQFFANPDIRSSDVLIETCASPTIMPTSMKDVVGIASMRDMQSYEMKLWHDTKAKTIAHAHIHEIIQPPPLMDIRLGNVPLEMASFFTGFISTGMGIRFSSDAGLTILAANGRAVLHLGDGGRNIFMPDMTFEDSGPAETLPFTYSVASSMDTALAPYTQNIQVTQTSLYPLSPEGRLFIQYNVSSKVDGFVFEEMRDDVMAMLNRGIRDIKQFNMLFSSRFTNLEMQLIP